MQTLLNAQPTAPRGRQRTIPQILLHHFFRRFFDNDTLSTQGETETTVIRSLCGFAVPGLMVAFWLLPRYPGRDLWATAADRYFFVLYSFVAMGAVATFQWEMLFPDRADFLILLPLPLKSRELFYAKGRALLVFLAMFLVAANLFALILFPAVSTGGHDNYLHSVCAHLIAVSLAGVFAAVTMLAVSGLAVCLLPPNWFRRISPVLQALSITLLLLLFLLFPLISTHLKTLLEGHADFAYLIPPLWFLGLYEHLALGQSAPEASQSLANIGLIATAIASALAILAYPLAWRRQKKRALEGSGSARVRSRSILATLLHRTLLRRPQQRAVFHFLTQTITRYSRYQVYLAIYSGVGLALALCSVLTVRQAAGPTLTPALSIPGLHAVLPLLLFWMVLGLKAAFAFPADMHARWVFPLNLPVTGQDAKAAKLWVLLCCGLLTGGILALLLALHWSYWTLAIQAVCGIALSPLLVNLFFLGRTRIPFTSPRMPGRTNLPIVFVLYAAIFPALVLATVSLELQTELHGALLTKVLLWTIGLLILLKIADQLARKGIIADLAGEDEEDAPQILGLSQ